MTAEVSLVNNDYLQLFNDYCKKRGEDWVVSWHLSIDCGIPTKKLNYHLGKLVNSGLLVKKTGKNYTVYAKKAEDISYYPE
jgi:hypothetical protein